MTVASVSSLTHDETDINLSRIPNGVFDEVVKEQASATNRLDKKSAHARKKRADKTAAKAVQTVSSLAHDETVCALDNGRIPNGVLDRVAKETGLSKGTLKNAVSLANQVGVKKTGVERGFVMRE